MQDCLNRMATNNWQQMPRRFAVDFATNNMMVQGDNSCQRVTLTPTVSPALSQNGQTSNHVNGRKFGSRVTRGSRPPTQLKSAGAKRLGAGAANAMPSSDPGQRPRHAGVWETL